MQSLITQFELLKQQVLAFESALKNTIPPSAPDPNNIINSLAAAKEKARFDIQARTDARIAELSARAPARKPYESARMYLARVEQEIRRIEGERAVRRRKPNKFQIACAEVRAAHPTMPDKEVYFAARMRLKVKACLPGLAALNNN
jgi:hypothetical protein